jgi:hypothetical protein
MAPRRFFEAALKETRPSVTPEMEREYRELAAKLKQASVQGPRIGFQAAKGGRLTERRSPLHRFASALRATCGYPSLHHRGAACDDKEDQ